MPNERDPRVDPRPGDVLAKQVPRTVTRVEAWRVWYSYPIKSRIMEFSETMNAWRKWAATAQVVKRGE